MTDIKNICITEDKSIKEAMNVIDHGGLRIAFVVDQEKKFIGLATAGDIRRAIMNGAKLNTMIKEIMNTSPLVIKKEKYGKKFEEFFNTEEAKKKLSKLEIIRIPVLDKEKKIVDVIIASQGFYESYQDSDLGNKSSISRPVNKVLVIGGAGYLGSVLTKKLLDRGYTVRVLDNLTYGDYGIKDLASYPKFEFVKGDMRDIHTVVKAVKNIDAVVHLAAIVGDPASALDPEETIEVNYLGTKMLGEVCKYSQINRFIFASTCSVYGASPTPDTKIDEKSQLNPVSLYAEMKLKSEQALLELADENFSPTILRMATLYGLSPRMRFDLVVNILTIKAIKEKKYNIYGGQQWRPILHVDDAAEAYIACLEKPLKLIKKEIFNTGGKNENYRIIEIGKVVKKVIPSAEMSVDAADVDRRNYNVSFDKIRKNLNYITKYTVLDGVEEIKKAAEKNMFNDYTNPRYNNYKFLQESNFS